MSLSFFTRLFSLCFLGVYGFPTVRKLQEGFPALQESKVDPGDKLIFLQAVWRHGDRSPVDTFKNDPYQENSWPQGWGQLSPKGMEQHVYLGRHRLKTRYIDALKFLSPYYKNHEIYVRSTDVNRTLASALANMIGMYSENARPGIDFPNCTNCWPTGFIPIAVHSEREETDYTLNTDAYCPRQSELQALLKETPEYKQLVREKKDFFDYLSNNAGEVVKPTDLWKFYDALFIEQLNNKSIAAWLNRTWDGQRLFDVINQTNALVQGWVNGLDIQPYKGIDFRAEASKIRGGTLLWSLIGHMEQKVQCLKDPQHRGCKFFNPLKYYAYSAHDTTLAALFSTLGFERTNYNEDGYPRYSSCLTVELWQKASGEFFVKFLYWPLGEATEEVTAEITGCSIPCSLQQLHQRSLSYKAEPSIEEWCETPLFLSKSTDESSNLMSHFGSSLKYIFFDSWNPLVPKAF